MICPSAIVAGSINSLFSAQGALQSALQQARMQNAQLGIMAQTSQMNTLSNYGDMFGQQQLASQQAAHMPLSAAFPSKTGIYERNRAKDYAETGERLLNHIAFWSAFVSVPLLGVFADRIVMRLAGELEAVADEVGRWLDMAANKQA